MKRKNLFLVCMAVGFCMVCVVVLLKSMGIYAEKIGTEAFMLQQSDSEDADALTDVLAGDSENGDVILKGAVTDEEINQIWLNLYEKYHSSKEGQEEIVKWAKDSEMMDRLVADGDGDEYGLSYDSANLSREEAGLIMLKEINRLFAEETLNQLFIESICMETSVGINEVPYISWMGRFTNGLDIVDPNYVSYDFEVDAVSGKIIRCQRFHSYQKGKDYSSISWTDEEILEQAGKWIETYDLAFGEALDWTNAELINVTEDVPSMMKELEEGSFTSLGNIVVFPKNGKRYFYISIDFETGNLESYLWPGTSASDEILK